MDYKECSFHTPEDECGSGKCLHDACQLMQAYKVIEAMHNEIERNKTKLRFNAEALVLMCSIISACDLKVPKDKFRDLMDAVTKFGKQLEEDLPDA